LSPRSGLSSQLQIVIERMSNRTLIYWDSIAVLCDCLRPQDPAWMALAGGPLGQLLGRGFQENEALEPVIHSAMIMLPWAAHTTSRWVRGRSVCTLYISLKL
jgi:hypothetical protein